MTTKLKNILIVVKDIEKSKQFKAKRIYLYKTEEIEEGSTSKAKDKVSHDNRAAKSSQDDESNKGYISL